MSIDPRTPTTTAEARLVEMIKDLQRRIAELERKVARG